MSGHNKWSTIKHKKGAADAKRGKVFSKIAKEIMVAARNGGDPAANPTLRALIQKGRSVNMPRDNIDRAIKKGTGELGAVIFEEIMYEGYAGAGVGLMVICLTDNKNRAAAEIRHIFSKHGSSFAQQGSVSRGFQRKGQIFIDASSVDEDKLMDIVLEAGADDMTQDGDQFEVITDPSTFSDVVDALEAAEIETGSASVGMVADVLTAVDDKGKIKSILKFVAALEDNDDVQDVFTNLDAPDAIMQEIAEEE